MKRITHLICTVLVIALLLSIYLFSPPARAASVELTRLTISFNEQTEPFGFKPDQTEYTLYYTSAAPVEITVTAQAADGCKLKINNVAYDGGAGSQTQTVSDCWIIEAQVMNGVHTVNYSVTVYITPPTDAGDGNDSGGNGQSGGSGDSGSGSDSSDSSDGGGTADPIPVPIPHPIPISR